VLPAGWGIALVVVAMVIEVVEVGFSVRKPGFESR
jgi:hypothetical protein